VLRWALAVVVVAVAVGPPVAFFRYQYAHAKRLREVTPGVLYRSGQMTAAGLEAVVGRYGIKTVVNLQHENPDPLLVAHWMGKPTARESELCRRLGVKYVLLTPDLVPQPNRLDRLPPAVDEFLAVMDDPANHPVLLHCKAGLHRTGRLTAIYRMEYQNWGEGEALREMRANGYGRAASSEADEFVVQFVQNYVPRARRSCPLPAAPPPRAVPPTGGRE
jgi:protein tyrosine/serine phosphatase